MRPPSFDRSPVRPPLNLPDNMADTNTKRHFSHLQSEVNRLQMLITSQDKQIKSQDKRIAAQDDIIQALSNTVTDLCADFNSLEMPRKPHWSDGTIPPWERPGPDLCPKCQDTRGDNSADEMPWDCCFCVDCLNEHANCHCYESDYTESDDSTIDRCPNCHRTFPDLNVNEHHYRKRFPCCFCTDCEHRLDHCTCSQYSTSSSEDDSSSNDDSSSCHDDSSQNTESTSEFESVSENHSDVDN